MFFSQNSVWVVQAHLRKYCSNLLKLHMSSRAERQVLASALCICIGHSFHLGSNKCNTKISSVVREFIHAGCPVRLWSGRQQYMHNPSAASAVSGMISISVMYCCANSLHSIFFYREVFQNKLSVFLKRKELLLSSNHLKRQDHKEWIRKAHYWHMWISSSRWKLFLHY